MENQENTPNEFEKDEISNPEQFQVSRAPGEEKTTEREDDSDYTEGEVEFADGEGTDLAEAFEDTDDEELDGNLDDEPEDGQLDAELADEDLEDEEEL